jgi:small multidrug resistance family-3 protein
LREDYSWIAGALGGLVLFLYGIIPTFQPSNFGRVYAAYGGIFIIMALLWGCIFENVIPDIYDILGTILASLGIILIFYYPRKNESKVGITSTTTK